MGQQQVTGLTVVEDILGLPHIEACMPPHVPVPKPGPCKGFKRSARKGTASVKPKKRPPRTLPPRTRAYGRDLRGELDFAELGELPAPNRVTRRGTVRNREDVRMKRLAQLQGFDGRPQLVDSQELRELRRAGGKELWRGIGTNRDTGRDYSELADEFRNGDVYYGFGYFGNGIYTADNLREARRYGESIERMVLPRDAKIADYSTLEQEMNDQTPPGLRQQREQQQRQVLEDIEETTNSADAEAIVQDYVRRTGAQGRDILTTDIGLYAMAQGYDAIKVPTKVTAEGQPYYVILNRSALSVLDKTQEA